MKHSPFKCKCFYHLSLSHSQALLLAQYLTNPLGAADVSREADVTGGEKKKEKKASHSYLCSTVQDSKPKYKSQFS